jgi:flagellar basal-body rod protein FlgC
MSGYLTSFEISASGMTAERMRLDVASMNLANATTVRGSGVGLYRPLQVVTEPASLASFERAMAGEESRVGVTARVIAVDGEPRRVHEPNHPLADANGFIEQPNVNPVVEMTQIMLAVRAYEANVKALNAARTMAQRALQIGEA